MISNHVTIAIMTILPMVGLIAVLLWDMHLYYKYAKKAKKKDESHRS